MKRYHANWLEAFVSFCSHREAPSRMYFWTGVSTLAGALRRKVWIDQFDFRWLTNFYIILVAPPGVVAKSTTAGVGMNLLRAIPDIQFGPNSVTWPSLVRCFNEAKQQFQLPSGDWEEMSALTVASSEFGNFLDATDRRMLDLLVELWDGSKTFEKTTVKDGSSKATNLWFNLIACTTPSWIADNFGKYTIGGGFTARCIFVYADKKERFVAYPGLETPSHQDELQKTLISDLEHIATNLTGEYALTREAVEWGKAWYRKLWDGYAGSNEAWTANYIARKQTHLHKLAMILAAAKRDQLAITRDDLAEAEQALIAIEADMPTTFALIGRTEISLQAKRLIEFIARQGRVDYQKAYRLVHATFPNANDFEGILSGAIRAGYIKMEPVNGTVWLSPTDKISEILNPAADNRGPGVVLPLGRVQG